ncbi:MAG: PD-(D/E)XK nuclease family protein [Ornithinimicrobium sp.]
MSEPKAPGKLLSVSPSRLGTWLDCPRAYRLQYLDRPRPPQAAARAIASIGNSTHAALAQFWDLADHERTPAAVEELMSRVWQRAGFADARQSEQWRVRATRWVIDYLRTIDRAKHPAAVERTVAMPTDTLAITGRVDQVEERDGELVVIDYKTGSAGVTPGSARTSLALGLYALAVSRMFRRPVRLVELHHVPTRSLDVHRHTDESLARKLAEAESIGLDLRAAHQDYAEHGADSTLFAARPSALCRWCSVQQHCPEGLAMGPAHPGEVGLDVLAATVRSAGTDQSPEDAAPEL